MKKYLFICLSVILTMCFGCINAFSQTENSDTTFVYGEIQGKQRNGAEKLTITVCLDDKVITYFTNENGTKQTPRQMHEAMNFLVKEGWQFVQAYSTSYVVDWMNFTDDSYSVTHWIIKKKKNIEK